MPMNDISPSSNCSSSADQDSNDDENNSTASSEFIDTEEIVIVAAGYAYSPLPDIQILPNNSNNDAPHDYFLGSSINSTTNTSISQENYYLNYTDIKDDLLEQLEDDCNRISSPTSTEDLSHLSQSNFDSATDSFTAANTERIQQAVRSIRQLAPHLAHKMDAGWEETQRNTCLVAQHPIIPLRPLAAFSELLATTKALNATQNLSRSATLAEIIVRAPTIFQRQDSNKITIHLVGADGVECENISTIQVLFCPFVRWLDAFLKRTQLSSLLLKTEQVQIVLIGPNIPMTATTAPIDLLPLVRKSDSHLKAASASCVTGLYHEYLAGQLESPPSHADLVVAFNAGIWGYNDWNPTIEILATKSTATPVTFVVTAYTLEESLDDADAIEQIVLSLSLGDDNSKKNLLWKPQINPFRSRIPRKTATAKEGRIYYENCAWHAWKFGGE